MHGEVWFHCISVEQHNNVGPQVNIIPVIGKADSCTPSEVQKFKAKVGDVDDGTESNSDAQILVQLEEHSIQIYQFPETELEPEVNQSIMQTFKVTPLSPQAQWMRSCLPFAVVGSNTIVTNTDTGAKYRGREYPWGEIEGVL